MIDNELIAIIDAYNSDDYYKHGNIPAKKLQAAVQNYPVDPMDTPLALIDTTVFGSAKTGMVIGLKGVYFKNDWTTKTEKNFLSWSELSNSQSIIGNGSMSCILLAPGCEINMSGSSMKRELLINLLNQIIDLYRSLSTNQTEVDRQAYSSSPAVDNVALIANKESSDSRGYYSSLLPELLALCVSADGKVEDEEIEFATAIIEEDDIIEDKHSALELLSSSIDTLIAAKMNLNAIFKLKSTTIISKVQKISDDLHKERLLIVLEGILDAISDEGKSETQNVVEAIKKKL